MIKRKIRALEDCNFKNELGFWMLTEGEVATIAFKSEEDLASHLELGKIELAEDSSVENRPIDVILPKNELAARWELSGNLDKLDEPDVVEEVQVDPLYTKKVGKKERRNPWVVT